MYSSASLVDWVSAVDFSVDFSERVFGVVASVAALHGAIELEHVGHVIEALVAPVPAVALRFALEPVG